MTAANTVQWISSATKSEAFQLPSIMNSYYGARHDVRASTVHAFQGVAALQCLLPTPPSVDAHLLRFQSGAQLGAAAAHSWSGRTDEVQQ